MYQFKDTSQCMTVLSHSLPQTHPVLFYLSGPAHRFSQPKMPFPFGLYKMLPMLMPLLKAPHCAVFLGPSSQPGSCLCPLGPSLCPVVTAGLTPDSLVQPCPVQVPAQPLCSCRSRSFLFSAAHRPAAATLQLEMQTWAPAQPRGSRII